MRKLRRMSEAIEIAVREEGVWMEVRVVEQQEHWKTRLLWEQVFTEDSKEFLDYYYFLKTRDNEIYVVEEDGEIRSMLHLNPYRIQVENNWFDGKYIIAVATYPSYRKRGYMGTSSEIYAGNV